AGPGPGAAGGAAGGPAGGPAAGAGGGPEPRGPKGKGDDVIDADYEVKG
ncbi:MAG: hypothetical protein IMZ44_10145, partial [Planctomycetes bacterium]|nr:hypothetical protein [Planctomycetota bacterium]